MYVWCIGAVRNIHHDRVVQRSIQAAAVYPATSVVQRSSTCLEFSASSMEGVVWRADLAGCASTCTCPRFAKEAFCKHVAFGLSSQGLQPRHLTR